MESEAEGEGKGISQSSDRDGPRGNNFGLAQMMPASDCLNLVLYIDRIFVALDVGRLECQCYTGYISVY